MDEVCASFNVLRRVVVLSLVIVVALVAAPVADAHDQQLERNLAQATVKYKVAMKKVKALRGKKRARALRSAKTIAVTVRALKTRTARSHTEATFAVTGDGKRVSAVAKQPIMHYTVMFCNGEWMAKTVIKPRTTLMLGRFGQRVSAVNVKSGSDSHGKSFVTGRCLDASPSESWAQSALRIAQQGSTSAKNEKITICHATSSVKNPYVEITVDLNGLNGHGDHVGDIIPAPAGGCKVEDPDDEATTPDDDPSTDDPSTDDPPTSDDDTPLPPEDDDRGGSDKITICHATSSAKNPFVEITVDSNGLNGHGDHAEDMIPAPTSGCPGGDEPEPETPVDPPTSCGENGKDQVRLYSNRSFSLKFVSCQGPWVKIYSDPFVQSGEHHRLLTSEWQTLTSDRYTIGYGTGKITLPSGKVVTWDTEPEMHMISYLQVTAPSGSKQRVTAFPLGRLQSERTSMLVALTTRDVRDFSAALKKCEGEMSERLNCDGSHLSQTELIPDFTITVPQGGLKAQQVNAVTFAGKLPARQTAAGFTEITGTGTIMPSKSSCGEYTGTLTSNWYSENFSVSLKRLDNGTVSGSVNVVPQNSGEYRLCITLNTENWAQNTYEVAASVIEGNPTLELSRTDVTPIVAGSTATVSLAIKSSLQGSVVNYLFTNSGTACPAFGDIYESPDLVRLLGSAWVWDNTSDGWFSGKINFNTAYDTPATYRVCSYLWSPNWSLDRRIVGEFLFATDSATDSIKTTVTQSAGSTRSISVTGTSSKSQYLEIWASKLVYDYGSCTSLTQQLTWYGSAQRIAQLTVNGSFTHTVSFTPAKFGMYRLCGYLTPGGSVASSARNGVAFYEANSSSQVSNSTVGTNQTASVGNAVDISVSGKSDAATKVRTFALLGDVACPSILKLISTYYSSGSRIAMVGDHDVDVASSLSGYQFVDSWTPKLDGTYSICSYSSNQTFTTRADVVHRSEIVVAKHDSKVTISASKVLDESGYQYWSLRVQGQVYGFDTVKIYQVPQAGKCTIDWISNNLSVSNVFTGLGVSDGVVDTTVTGYNYGTYKGLWCAVATAQGHNAFDSSDSHAPAVIGSATYSLVNDDVMRVVVPATAAVDSQVPIKVAVDYESLDGLEYTPVWVSIHRGTAGCGLTAVSNTDGADSALLHQEYPSAGILNALAYVPRAEGRYTVCAYLAEGTDTMPYLMTYARFTAW